MPAFAAEYAPWPTAPMSPAPDDVFTIRPSTSAPSLACARHHSVAWRVVAKWPLRWTRITASHSSSPVVNTMRSRRKPALFTSTSRPPNVSIAVCTSRRAPSQSAMSSVLATASPPERGDLVDHLLRRAGVGAGAVAGDAEIVHDDARALTGERQRVLSTDAAGGARDDDDAAVADTGHELTLLRRLGPSPYRRARVAGI